METPKTSNEVTTKQFQQRNARNQITTPKSLLIPPLPPLIETATLPPRPDATTVTRPILIPPLPPAIGPDSSDEDLYNDVPKGINESYIFRQLRNCF